MAILIRKVSHESGDLPVVLEIILETNQRQDLQLLQSAGDGWGNKDRCVGNKETSRGRW